MTPFQRALRLIPRDRRWQWLALVPLALVSALLEGLGAGAVMALGTVLADPAQTARLPLLARLAPNVAADSRTLILAIIAGVVAFYLVRGVLLTLFVWIQDTVVQRTAASVAVRLFRAYMNAPYVFHLRRNSANLIQTAGQSVDNTVTFVLGSAVNLAIEGFTLAGLVGVLAWTAPLATLLSVLVIGVLLVAPFLVTRRLAPGIGAAARDVAAALVQDLQQSLASFKDVRLKGVESHFSRAVARRRERLATLKARQDALATGLRVSVETILIVAILVTVMVVTARGMQPAQLVGLMALYAYVGFRVIPAANRLTMHYAYVVAALPHVERVCDDLELLASLPTSASESADGAGLRFEHAVEVSHVSFSYDDERGTALDDVSLTVARGTSVGIVGATGSGKSTLVDVLLGLLTPDAGHVLVDGQDVRGRERAWQRRVGYVPQDIALLDDTLRRNVAFGVTDAAIDDVRVNDALRHALVLDVVDSWPAGLDTVLGERGARLSGGERQRVAIARALYHDPDVLVLDEATSALDTQTEQALVSAIDALRGEKTLVVVAHRLSTVQHCASVVFLQDGRVLAEGTFDELVQSQPEFRALVSAGVL